MLNRKKLRRLRESKRIERANSEKVQASLSDQACRLRQSETMEAASVVHGGTPEDNSPTLDGLWHTIVNESTPHLEYILATQKRS